jgi:mRNA interferase MazF
MSYHGPVRQWDIFIADLDYPVGSEQGGSKRPVMVVSNDAFNNAFPVVTIIPLTKAEGKRRRVYPFEIEVPGGLFGNPLDSIIMPHQIRTIDKTRLLEPMGHLEEASVRRAIEDRLMQHLGIDLEDGDED